jgi:methyl-accepting chemotaxis protein
MADRRIRIVVDADSHGDFGAAANDLERLARNAEEADKQARRSSKGFQTLDAEIKKTDTSVKALQDKFSQTGDLGLLGDLDKQQRQLGKLRKQMEAFAGKGAEKVKIEAEDKTEPAVRSAIVHLELLRNRADELGKYVRKRFVDMAQAVGRFGVNLAAWGSLTGPAVAGTLAIVHGVEALGRGLVTVAPAVAVLPSIAAGFGLIAGTVKLAGPAMAQALKPVSEAVAGLRDHVGKLASEGLRQLATEFVHVNLPAIRSGMDAIAVSLNRVAVGVGQWLNSTAGQQAIGQITLSTAAAMRQLEAPLTRVVAAFGNLVARVGGGAITGVAGALSRVADATARWLDSLSKGDVDKALASLAGWGVKVREVFAVLRDVGNWLEENQGKVKAFSDAVAGIGIVLGAATGNWAAVAISAFSLIINHWQGVKQALAGGAALFSDMFAAIRNDPNVQGIFASMKADFKGFVDSFRKEIANIGPQWQALVTQLKAAWDQWGPVIKAWWDAVGKPVFSALGTALGMAVISFLELSTAAAHAAALAGAVWRNFLTNFLAVVGAIINGAAAAFGWIPGIGPKLEAAAANFNSFASRANAALSGIHDRTVNIDVITHYRGTPPSDLSYEQIPTGRIGGMRRGGIRHAAAGLLAGLYPDGADVVHFAERGTGGEAYVPRLGIGNDRGLALADVAARWHGGRVVKGGATASIGGGRMVLEIAGGGGGSVERLMAEVLYMMVRNGQLRLRAGGDPVTA